MTMQVEKHALWHAWAMGAIFLFLPVLRAVQQSALQLPQTSQSCSVDLLSWEEGDTTIPADALQGAGIIGVECGNSRLSELITARIDYLTIPSLGKLWLCQNITDAIVTASLDADTLFSEIDFERERFEEVISLSHARRDRDLVTTNLAILTESRGLGIAVGDLSFDNGTSDTGDALAFAPGGMSTLFSNRELRQSKEKAHAKRLLPNMLEPFGAQPEENHGLYSEIAWTHLNSRPLGECNRVSRMEQLLAQRAMADRLSFLTSRRSKDNVSLLTTIQSGKKKLDVALLT